MDTLEALDAVIAASRGHAPAAHGADHGLELLLMGIVLILVLSSLWQAWIFYGKKSGLPDRTARALGGFYRLVFNKYYVDELYDAVIARPLLRLSESALWRFVDTRIIDGAVNGIAALVGRGARSLSRTQTGFVQNYALVFVLGAVVLLLYLLVQ